MIGRYISTPSERRESESLSDSASCKDICSEKIPNPNTLTPLLVEVKK